MQVRDHSAEELCSKAAFSFLKMNRASSEVLIQADELKYSSAVYFYQSRKSAK